MTNKLVFGEVDWNTGDSGTGSTGKSDFMRLTEGENIVRVMARPVQFYVHWVTLPDGQKRKITSPISDSALVTELETMGFKKKPTWMLKVLDRSDDKFKLLEIGSQIYSGIRSLVNHPKWGKCHAYDVSIFRGSPGTQPLYTVTPNPKEALQSTFKSSFEAFNDGLNIESLISPSDPAKIRDMLNLKHTSTSNASDDDGDFQFSFDD